MILLTGCGRVYCFEEKCPRIADSVFLDPLARVLGDVELGEEVAVLAYAVIRGDDDSVHIGDKSVILEHVLVEAPHGHPVSIGEESLISHGAIVHGATIGHGSLIGIGARVLDGAEVGEHAIVAAGAVVPPGKKVPDYTIVAGIPAKPVREVTEKDIEIVKRELMAVHRKVPVYRRIFKC